MSVMRKDGEEHALQAEASSLMHAAYAGVQAWARFWWWPSDGMLEVRSGGWGLASEGVRRYRLYSERFPGRRDAY